MTDPRRTGPIVLAVALALWGAALAAACNGGQRFPVCRSNAECTERDGGAEAPICFNLRCVGCQYDTDCAPGEACTTGNRCAALSERSGLEDAGVVRWDPGTWSQCAERCKDKACLKRCSERFEQ